MVLELYVWILMRWSSRKRDREMVSTHPSFRRARDPCQFSLHWSGIQQRDWRRKTQRTWEWDHQSLCILPTVIKLMLGWSWKAWKVTGKCTGVWSSTELGRKLRLIITNNNLQSKLIKLIKMQRKVCCFNEN